MKKVLKITAISAFSISQAIAIEVYNNDEKDAKVEVYGSLRGYVGLGSNLNSSFDSNVDSANADTRGIFGLQSSSRLGVAAKIGKAKATIELGAAELAIRQTVRRNLRSQESAYCCRYPEPGSQRESLRVSDPGHSRRQT